MIVAMLAAGVVVFLLLTVAVFLYNAFDSEETIEATPLELKNVITDEDYSMLNVLCECQSEKIAYDAEDTPSGYGCKRRILSQNQKQDLPECEL